MAFFHLDKENVKEMVFVLLFVLQVSLEMMRNVHHILMRKTYINVFPAVFVLHTALMKHAMLKTLTLHNLVKWILTA